MSIENIVREFYKSHPTEECHKIPPDYFVQLMAIVRLERIAVALEHISYVLEAGGDK